MGAIMRLHLSLPTLLAAFLVVLSVTVGSSLAAQLTIKSLGSADFNGAPTSSNAFPFGATSMKYATMWTPVQLGGQAQTIEEFGWQFSATTNRTLSNVKYWMGHTSSASPVVTVAPFPLFTSYFNEGPPPVLVFDGPLSVVTSGNYQYQRTVLDVPFNFSGNHNLMVLVESTGPTGTSTQHTVYTGSVSNFRAFNSSIAESMPSAQTNNHACGASFGFTPLPPPPVNELQIVAGTTGGARSANSTVDIPISLSNPGAPEVTLLQFTVNIATTSLVYDNFHQAFGAGSLVSVNPNAGGSVTVTVIGSVPIPTGKFVELRFRVPISVGTQASAAAHTVTISAPLARNSQSVALPVTTVNGKATLSNHKFVVGNAYARVTALSEFEVPVSLSNLASTQNVATAQFKLWAGSTDVEYIGSSAGPAMLAAGKNLTVTGSANSATVSIQGNPGVALGDGELLRVRFRVKQAGASPGYPSLYLTDLTATDSGMTPAPILVFNQDGVLTLSAYSSRDTNQDGIVDVVDVQLIVNIILSAFTPVYPFQGDANGDETVDVVDVQSVVNCILAMGDCG